MKQFIVCITILAALMVLTACENSHVRYALETVQVKIPLIERAEAPPELWRSPISANSLPYWIAPSDPKASACVSAENEPKLKSLLLNRESLLDGWEKYATP